MMKKTLLVGIILSLVNSLMFAGIGVEGKKKVVVKGTSIAFVNTTNDASVKWGFVGGKPSTSFDNNPTITYDSIGTYDVQLTVYENGDSTVLVASDYVIVADSVKPSSGVRRSSTSHGSIGADIIHVNVNGVQLTTGTIASDITSGIADENGYIDTANTIVAYAAYTGSGDSVNFFVESYALQPSSRGISISVFVDWNNDGQISENLDEKIVSYFGSSTTKTWTGKFAIPEDCVKDKVLRLRITSDAGSFPLGGSVTHGNGEDVGLYIHTKKVLAISNELTKKEYTIYPQPASDNIYIEQPNGDNVQVVGMNGVVLLTQWYTVGTEKITINTQSLPNGVYLLRFSNGDAQRIIID